MTDEYPIESVNPRITRTLVWVTAAELVALVVTSFGLLIFPSVILPEWPWELSRFNAMLLGSIYSGALVATVITLYVRRWAPARIVLPMNFLFGSVVLVVSLLYFDRFGSNSYGTWLWFPLYVLIPGSALYHMWQYRNLKPLSAVPLERTWRLVLLIPTILLGLYGLGLLFAPGSFSSFWPWPIDDFHVRVYSVAFLTPALGAILLFPAAAAVETLTLGLSMVIGGLVPIVGLPLIDLQVNKVDWSQVGTWIWMGSFTILLLVGVGLTWRSRQQARVLVH